MRDGIINGFRKCSFLALRDTICYRLKNLKLLFVVIEFQKKNRQLSYLKLHQDSKPVSYHLWQRLARMDTD